MPLSFQSPAGRRPQLLDHRAGSSRRCRPRLSSARPVARSGVRSPRSRTRSIADSTAAAASSIAERVPQHQRHGAEGGERVGDALARDVGRRAVHRLVQGPGPPAPRLADASSPIEPAIIAASSERMSPNMFSVSSTSKCRGARDQLHRRVVDQHVLEPHARVVARDLLDRLAPQARGLEDVRLVDRDHVAPPRRRGRDARRPAGDPLDLLGRIDAGVVRDAAAPPAVAEVDAARQLAHDQQVGAADALLPQRARVGRAPGLTRTGRRFANSSSPLRSPRRPCSGRGASGSVVSHFGPPTAPSSTASAERQRSSTSGSSGVPCSSIEIAADRQLLDLEASVEAARRSRPAAAARRRRPPGRCRRPGERDDRRRRGTL